MKRNPWGHDRQEKRRVHDMHRAGEEKEGAEEPAEKGAHRF
jgi:hypothetical protein